nr:hypothetical protein [uncultured Brumimicrobium sp.]
MKNIFITALIILSSNAHAQELNEANKNLIAAKQLSIDGYIDSAIISYELAFKQIEYVHSSHIHQIIKLAKQRKDRDRIKKYKKQLKEKKKCKNTQLKAEIDSISEWDKMIRMGVFNRQFRYYNACNEDSLCDKSSINYLEAKKYYDSAMVIDANNQQALLDILKKEGGYKGQAAIGTKYEFDYYRLILHFDTDTNNRILKPYLDEALEKGYLTTLTYTYVLDRHEYHTMGTQTYWSWPILKEDPNLTDEQIAEANERRKSMGIFSKISSIEKKGDDWLIINEK